MTMRINKYLSQSGVCSRRKADELILSKNVKINGRVAGVGDLVEEGVDNVEVNGNTIMLSDKNIYIALNKPLNVLSSVTDDRGRTTVCDLIDSKEKLFPVGRLDYNSTGLILLTNDGDLAQKITHPKYHLAKTYQVVVNKQIIMADLNKLHEGVVLEGKITAKADVKKTGGTTFDITLYQGLKRQIREMCKVLGYEVESIHRIKIGPVEIGKLKSGEYRNLTNKEVQKLKN